MFNLEIITPDGIYFNKAVRSLTVYLSNGYVTILKGHDNLMGLVKKSKLHLVYGNKTYYYEHSKGVLTVQKNKVKLIVDNISEVSE